MRNEDKGCGRGQRMRTRTKDVDEAKGDFWGGNKPRHRNHSLLHADIQTLPQA
jgi:hypothetical protein